MVKYNLSPDTSIKLTKCFASGGWKGGLVGGGRRAGSWPSPFPRQPRGFHGAGFEEHIRGPGGGGVCRPGAGTRSPRPRLGAQGAWPQHGSKCQRQKTGLPPTSPQRPAPLSPPMPTPPPLLRRCSARDGARRSSACTLKPSWSAGSQGSLHSLGVCSTAPEPGPRIRPRGLCREPCRAQR